MRAPRLLAVGTAAVCLAVLSGCTKPSPGVSVESGPSYAHVEATSYCYPGQDPTRQPGSAGACSFDSARKPALIKVKPGAPVAVDVDKKLADSGWFIVVAPTVRSSQSQQQRSSVQATHFFSFVPQFTDGTPIQLQVRSLAKPEDSARVTGTWTFVLAPQ